MSTSSRRAGNPAKGLAGRSSGAVNPVIASAIFSHQFNTTGGATMNVHTNEVAKPGSPGYVVGGHGMPTEYHDTGHAQRLDTILGHRTRIRQATTADPHAALGYWVDREAPQPKAEVDASSIFRDRRKAVATGRSRGEKAVWDLGKMQEIRLR